MNGPELPLNYIITFITGIKKSLMCVDVTTIIYYQQAIYSVYYFFFNLFFFKDQGSKLLGYLLIF